MKILIFILMFTPTLVNAQFNYDTTVAVRPSSFGATGNGTTNDATAIVNTFTYAAANGLTVYMPLSYNISSNITLPANSALYLKGSLVGTGQITLSKGNNIYGGGAIKTTPSTAAIFIKGSDTKIDNISFSDNYNCISEIIIVAPVDTIKNVSITKCDFRRTNYGILKQGGDTTVKVSDVLIDRNVFKNLKGDAIEWNQGTADLNITVSNNNIDSIDATTANAGIGIGFAGGTYNDYNNRVSNVNVFNDTISHVRQGIHFEACNNFTVKNNVLSNHSIKFSRNTGLVEVGLAIYGCMTFTIDNNSFSNFDSLGSIQVQAGSGVSTNSCQSLDYTISSNVADNAGLISSLSAGETDINIIGNTCINGSAMRIYGASRLNVARNNIKTAPGIPGLTLDYVSSSAFVSGFNASVSRYLTIIDNNISDSNYFPTLLLTKVTSDTRVIKKGNNFEKHNN